MLPRRRSGSTTSAQLCAGGTRASNSRASEKSLIVGALTLRRVVVLSLAGGLLFLLSGCGQNTVEIESKGPAASVPHGVYDNATDDLQITPRARVVESMQANAAAAGLAFFQLDGAQGPLAVVLTIDLTRFEPQLVTQQGGVRPVDAIFVNDNIAVVGSSFVSLVRTMQPIGLLQHNGTLLSKVEQHGYTRILGIAELGAQSLTPRRFVVVHRSEWQPDMFSSALQVGPGIIEQGALDISERDLQRNKYFRSFVAECGDTALIGASLVPTHLYTLGGELVRFFARTNLQCNEVVNLAGDRESVLMIRNQQSAAFFGDPQPLRAALIGFRARRDIQ